MFTNFRCPQRGYINDNVEHAKETYDNIRIFLSAHCTELWYFMHNYNDI